VKEEIWVEQALDGHHRTSSVAIFAEGSRAILKASTRPL